MKRLGKMGVVLLINIGHSFGVSAVESCGLSSSLQGLSIVSLYCIALPKVGMKKGRGSGVN